MNIQEDAQKPLDLLKAGRFLEAQVECRSIIQKYPQHFYPYFLMGLIALKQRDFSRSVKLFDKAVSINPNHYLSYLRKSSALSAMELLEDGLRSVTQSIALKADFPESYLQRGHILLALRRVDKALEDFDQAVALKPDFTLAYVNRGVALKILRRFDEAFFSLNEAIRLEPTLAVAYHNRAVTHLTLGNFEKALTDYEWRNHIKGMNITKKYEKPLWLGDFSIQDKTILIHYEQGLGDTILFSRYLNQVVEQGARVLFAPQKPLSKLMKTLNDKIEIVDREDQNLQFDCHCPLLSLPLVFKASLNNIPNTVPYLFTEGKRVAAWKNVIGQHGFKVGISWSCSKEGVKAGRAFPLKILKEISHIPNVRLISLQKGDGLREVGELPIDMKVETLGKNFDEGENAFLDCAAVMKCCDLIISCDTSITHLAGALNVNVWLAETRDPYWFWMYDRPDSPWYPSLRIFRQNVINQWDDVFLNMFEELQKIIVKDKAATIKNSQPGNVPQIPTSWGEVIDKITILEIKKEKLSGNSVINIVGKELALLTSCASSLMASHESLVLLKNSLRQINEALWEVEDFLREKERNKEFDERFIELARSVYKNNDKRAAVKREINMLLQSEIFEVKSYKEY